MYIHEFSFFNIFFFEAFFLPYKISLTNSCLFLSYLYNSLSPSKQEALHDVSCTTRL